MLVPKHIHPNQTIDSICEAFDYLDNAIYNEQAITLPASILHVEHLPKAFYVYAWHLRILDRVLYRMERHLRDLHSLKETKRKHEAIYQLSEALQDRYLEILAHSMLVRSQEIYECLIDGKDDEEISRELYNCLKETKNIGEILINLLRDCLEKDKDSEKMSQKLKKCLIKAEIAKETLWYPKRYLKEIDNRIALLKLYKCIETNSDVETLLLELQHQDDFNGYPQDSLLEYPRSDLFGNQCGDHRVCQRGHGLIGGPRDSLLGYPRGNPFGNQRENHRIYQNDDLFRRPRDSIIGYPRVNPFGNQYDDHRIYQNDDSRGYRFHQNISRTLDSQKLDICLQKASDTTVVLWNLCLCLLHSNESGEISQKLYQCFERANDAKWMLYQPHLDNNKYGDEISQKLHHCFKRANNAKRMIYQLHLDNNKYGDGISQKLGNCLEEIKNTGNILRSLCEHIQKDSNREEIEDVQRTCLSKVHDGRKILQELSRCFEKENDSAKLFQELYGYLEENDGEDGEQISQSLSKCLAKTKDAGGMLLEVLRDCFEEKQDATHMSPELLHDDDRKQGRGWKISHTPVSQKLNQKLDECLEKTKDAGGMLQELCKYLTNNDGGKLEDDVNYFLGKIFMASITCSLDEDVKALRIAFIRFNLIKSSREENSDKLSDTMRTNTDSFKGMPCGAVALFCNSVYIADYYRSGLIPPGLDISQDRWLTDPHEAFVDCDAYSIPHSDVMKICSSPRLGCTEHKCVLPLGHGQPHEFSDPCNADCVRDYGLNTVELLPHRINLESPKRSSAHQLVCKEDKCILPYGHTSPHHFYSRCNADCILPSDHEGSHLRVPCLRLSIDADRTQNQVIRLAAGAVHFIDKMVCESLLEPSIMNKTVYTFGRRLSPAPAAVLRGALADPHKKSLHQQPSTNTAGREAVISLYSKLDFSKKQIRLFELYPSTSASKIRGSFHYVELSAHEYIALSYTWGDDTPCREIEVNGKKISVLENLWWFLSLQSISISDPKFFWIDGICINQSDVEERNHQVGFMTQIYTNASAVYIWLGCESDNSDLAMEYMIRQASKKLEKKGMGFRPLWSKQEGRALAELCERPYWRRMWIIQEVISAKKIVALCGTKSFHWECFLKLYQKLKVLESTHWLAHHAFALAVFQSSASVIIWQRAYWRHPDTPKPSLKTLISIFSGWQCKDLRDKVYALVGMASPETAVIPDYSRSTLQICQDI